MSLLAFLFPALWALLWISQFSDDLSSWCCLISGSLVSFVKFNNSLKIMIASISQKISFFMDFKKSPWNISIWSQFNIPFFCPIFKLFIFLQMQLITYFFFFPEKCMFFHDSSPLHTWFLLPWTVPCLLGHMISMPGLYNGIYVHRCIEYITSA